MKNIKKQIETYTPYNQQEKKDRMTLLSWIDTGMDLFTRENSFAHWTASAWVVNQNMDRVLMVYHNIYDSWSWLGGHADGDEDLLAFCARADAYSGIFVAEFDGIIHQIVKNLQNLIVIRIDRQRFRLTELKLKLNFFTVGGTFKTVIGFVDGFMDVKVFRIQ